MGAKKDRITLAADRDAWDKQPGETDKMYARYLAYQQMGRTRTVKRVAEEDGKSVTYYQHVAWRHHWHERAAAWDREQDRLDREALIEERRKMVKTHMSLSTGMLGKVAARVRDLDPAELSTADVARWVDIITKVQRAALGEPDRTVAVQGGAAGAPPITIAELPTDERERLTALKATIERLAVDEDALAALDPAELEFPEELLG